MKIKLIVLSMMTYLFINLTYGEQSQPTKCPSLISPMPWSYALRQQGLFWEVVREKNKYDTDQEWTVLIGSVIANNEAGSFLHATEIVKKLKLIMGPETHQGANGKKVTACGYLHPDDEVYIVAFTPPQHIKKLKLPMQKAYLNEK